LVVLATLVDAYEDTLWPIDPPDPVEAIRFRMEQSGLKQSDLADLLGSASRASEILRRKRGLTMAMAWKLHMKWNIPAECLIKPHGTEDEDVA
ncbi:MAG: XRE family transcriptional regulator, partial [Alphaproteobacteria bacterium]|nr:XRE family transcriptional regulator [Alphaproteobacteria bacterium]